MLAIGSTMEVSEGVLQGEATFESLGVAHDKVLFEFTKREKVSGTRNSYKMLQKRRAVFADALKPLPPADASSLADAEVPTAFGAMAEAANRAAAFTHGMEGPELAAHERKRKLAYLGCACARA